MWALAKQSWVNQTQGEDKIYGIFYTFYQKIKWKKLT